MTPSDALFDSDAEQVACVHAELCAGCPLIDLPYSQQLQHKTKCVQTAIERYPSLQHLAVLATEGANPVIGYRTRVKWMLAPRAHLGLYAKGGGHSVVDIPSCLVVSPLLGAVAQLIRTLLSYPPEGIGAWWAACDGRALGALRAVDLREITGHTQHGALVTLVVERTRAPDLAQARIIASALQTREARVLGVALNMVDAGSPQVLGSQTIVVAGLSEAPDRIGSVETPASYGSFVQAHRGQAAHLQELVLEEARALMPPHPDPSAHSWGEGKRAEVRGLEILDLFGGTGAFAFALAQEQAHVDMVESYGPAAEAAQRKAQEQRLPVRVITGDAAEIARRLAVAGKHYDLVIVNPPRRGLAPGLCDTLSKLNPDSIAYISCNPDTLARDLDHMSLLGYQASALRPLDMIPLTEEVETIAILHRAALLPPLILYEDDEVIAVAKAPHEPTTPQGEYAGSLLSRVRTLAHGPHAVPIHRLDIGTSGVCFFAREASSVRAWAEALTSVQARKTYLALARGVSRSHGVLNTMLHDQGRARSATTHYRRLQVISGHSLLRVLPEQGRTHQIRRHLAAVGLPVVGDERYGAPATNRHFAEKHGLCRTFLHCISIELAHPQTRKKLCVQAPLWGDLRGVLERIGRGRDGQNAHPNAYVTGW